MRKLATILGVVLCTTVIHAQTNYISFTNVTVMAYTGYKYAGDTSDSLATLGAVVNLWDFNAGKKLGVIGIGPCVDVSLSANSTTLTDGALGLELMKNYENSQFFASASGTRNFAISQWGFAIDVGMRYNLYKASGYCAWLGANMRFEWLDWDVIAYKPGVQVGLAF
jgi:hypothetical protein